jgi:predicted metalloprotease with PDZ domain
VALKTVGQALCVALMLGVSGSAFCAETISAERRATPFPGTMVLDVDATDIDRRIFRVRQEIPVARSGELVLRFPEWLPGNHAPRGQIEKLSGLTIRAGNRVLPWKRDPFDVFSFHLSVPEGVRNVEARFEFLSATDPDQGRVVVTPAMLNLQWQSVSLYPAGWATKEMPIRASVTYPQGWQAATALRPASQQGNVVRYAVVDYETLVDSPVVAGKYFAAWPLGQNVTLNVVGDDAQDIVAKPEQIAAHQRLVDQAVRVFGSSPFDHYDFLVSLSDEMGSIGLEHHRSSENGVNPEYFTGWDNGPGRRNLLPHEFGHSWIGKYRRPAGQMVKDFATPLENSLLWVYEGQNQFWGYVLGARSGMFTKQETLDALANIAAVQDIRKARGWRSLDDTTADPVITARRPKGWLSWQRSEDYYNEGLLIWLEADGIIRQKTGGAKGMDDFARAFFGGIDGDFSARSFDLAEVVRTLNSIVAHDWQGFLDARLTEKASGAPLGGLALGGYRLGWSETPSGFLRDADRRGKEMTLLFSIGAVIKNGELTQVVWDGPMFNAGLTIGAQIIAVNGRVYDEEVLRDAVTAAKGGTTPIRLIVRTGRQVREVPVTWTGGHRYPVLEKVGTGPGSLDLLLMAR